MCRKKIIITMGDPLGVGPEIIVKALAADGVRGACDCLIIGTEHYLQNAFKITGISFDYNLLSQANEDFQGIALLEVETWQGEKSKPGKWSKESGRQSFLYVKKAVTLLQENIADALVTAPICKAAWKAAGMDYPGHTELLGEMCASDDEVMMLVGGGLRVALATIHEPLSRVPALITTERVIKVVKILHQDLQERFSLADPRIAVLGLNPHAGEDGCMGHEEQTEILPAINILRQEKINVTDPLPADTAFHRMLQGDFDAILAMYHDQGLAALKTVAFDSGVNVTLGLSIIRTSVDHGTAFNIAGENIASERSMLEAIKLSLEMTK